MILSKTERKAKTDSNAYLFDLIFNHFCTDKLSDDGILAFKPKNAFLAF
jgi:hypothetical protein